MEEKLGVLSFNDTQLSVGFGPTCVSGDWFVASGLDAGGAVDEGFPPSTFSSSLEPPQPILLKSTLPYASSWYAQEHEGSQRTYNGKKTSSVTKTVQLEARGVTMPKREQLPIAHMKV